MRGEPEPAAPEADPDGRDPAGSRAPKAPVRAMDERAGRAVDGPAAGPGTVGVTDDPELRTGTALGRLSPEPAAPVIGAAGEPAEPVPLDEGVPVTAPGPVGP